MDIKIIGDTGEEVKQEKSLDVKPDTVHVEGEILLQQVANLFDLKPSDISHYKDKLNTLIAYAKSKTKDQTIEGLKWAIRDLSFRVGTPPLGEKMIDYLTLYAHTRTKHEELGKQLDKFEHPSIENPTASD